MSGLINLIKSIFGGILSFISGLFSGKKTALPEASAPKTRKSAGYFLELDEASSEATSQPETQRAAAPVSVSEKPEVVPTAQHSAKKSESLAVTNGASTAKSATATPIQTAPVAVAPAAKEPKTVEFATKYLVPTSNGSRRRPGANMNPYLDMARGMKVGNN